MMGGNFGAAAAAYLLIPVLLIIGAVALGVGFIFGIWLF